MLLLAENSGLASLSLEVWVIAVLVLFVTAALGFFAGCLYSRNAPERELLRAKQQLSKLYAIVVQSLETAQKTCGFLEAFPNPVLTAEQIEKLDKRRSDLVQTVGGIVQKQQERVALAEPVVEPEPPVPFALEWERTAVDPLTGLPDRATFDANLAAMLAAGKAARVESGLLLVRVDKFDQLKERLGFAPAEKLLVRMSNLLCRTARDEDLVCRFNSDTIAFLVPNLDRDAACRRAEEIRQTVRTFHFRANENGPEVLVTASFGFAPCPAEDSPELAINRASHALAQSQRRGRNQLHLYDGVKLLHCVSG